MNTCKLRLLTTSLAALAATFSLTPLQAQTTDFTNGAGDTLWSTPGNWDNGSPATLGASAVVFIMTQPSTNTINIDTNTPTNTIVSMTFDASLTGSTTIASFDGNEQITLTSGITNSSTFVQNFTLPVNMSSSATGVTETLAGGTGGLNIGTLAINIDNVLTTGGNVAIASEIVTTINSNSNAGATRGFGQIGTINAPGITIAVGSDLGYTGAAGDFFQIVAANSNLIGTTADTSSIVTLLPTLYFNQTLIQKGILFVEPILGPISINAGVTLPIGNTSELDPNSATTSILLNGGELVTSNDAANDTGGTVGTAFSTGRAIAVNTTGGTIAATTGSTATYTNTAIISNGNGAGTLTIGDSSNKGTVTIAATNTNTGAVTVADGTLVLNGSFTPTTALTLSSGTTLSGSGTVGGTTSATSATVSGTGLTLSGLATFNGAGNILSGTETATAGVNVAAGASVTQSGTLTGSVTLANGAATAFTGAGTVGAVTLNGGGDTLTGAATLTTSGVMVNGSTNTIAGAVVGAVTQNATSSLTVTGTAGADALATGASLNGTGTVGAVTLAGTNTVSSTATLTTGGISVTGAGNVIGTGTITGAITQNANSVLSVTGTAGSDALATGAALSGVGTVGAVTLAGTNTVSSTATLTTGGISVTGAGNVIGTGTITGAITQNANSVLSVTGTAGSDALATGATLSGVGTVGAVTLAGTDTLSSTTTLHTSGITVSGIGNSITTGTVTGPVTFSGASALVVNGTASGTVAVSSGATLSGIGTTGAVTVSGGGNINLQDGAIGTLTVGGLSSGLAGTPSSFSFDIQTVAGTTSVDKIADTGTLTLNGAGGTTINIGSLAGTTALTNGTYTLVSSTALTGSLANVTLSTTMLDGSALALSVVGNALDLVVTTPVNSMTYTLAANAAAPRIMVNTGSTTITASITNTGNTGTLTYTGLNASITGTPPTGASLGAPGTLPIAAGGPLAASGGSDSGTTTLTAGSGTGAVTITPTVTTATNSSGTATATTNPTTVDIVDNRVVTASPGGAPGTPLAFGRVLVSTTTASQNVTFSSVTGQDASLTRISLGAGPLTATGVTNGTIMIGAGTAYQFGGANDATNSTTRGATGSFTTTGTQTGTAVITPTAEGLAGETVQPIDIDYSVDAVALRTITPGATTSLGILHSGAVVTGTANAFTSTGTLDTTTSVTVAGGSGTADVNGVTLTGATTNFNGATAGSVNGSTQTFGGTITGSGTVNGSFNLGVTTQEIGLGDTYLPVAVAYTATVYSGQSVWAGTGATGSWGTIAGTGAGAFGLNWGAGQGSPGLDPNFTSTDTATFNNVGAQPTETVTLDGASPSLKAVTFNSPATSYTLAPGTGGTLTLNGGVSAATVTNTAGTNTITAPVALATNTNVNVTAGQLTFNTVISGSGGLATTGTGLTILSGANTYTGPTTITSGTLEVDGSTLAASTVGVGTAGTLTGAGTVNGNATLTGNGTINLTNPGNIVGTLAVTGGNWTGMGTVAGAVTSSSNTFTIGTGANLTAPSGLSVTGGSLAGTGTVTGSINYSSASDSTFGGVIAGAGSTLMKSGASTLVLSGANVIGGGITLSAGTLVSNSATALGTGTLTQNGGTLTSLGTSGTNVINIGTNYVMNGGTLLLNLNAATSDELLVAGTATLNGTLSLNFTAAPTKGQMFTVIDATGGIIGVPGAGITMPVVSPAGFVITTAESMNGDDIVATVISTQLGLTATLGGSATPNQAAILNYIDTNALQGPLFNAISTALNGESAAGAAATAADVANQMNPEKFANFVRQTVFNNAVFTTQMQDNLFATQRSADGEFIVGNGQIDSSNLSIAGSGIDSSLAQISSRLLAWSPSPLAHGMLSDSPTPVLGGVDMKEMKLTSTATGPQHDFNTFILGNVVLGQDYSQPDLAHADTTTGQVQIGADYRITPHLRAGALFGYSHTDGTLDDNNSKATIDTYAPAVFASYVEKGWYANAVGTYGFNNYTEDRRLAIGGVNANAHGAPSGDQITGDIDGGYDFHMQGFTFGPLAGVQYTHLDVNSFNESGAEVLGANESVSKQEADSLRSRLGGHVSYAFQAGTITLTPHLDASWQHEFLDQSQGINAQIITLGGGPFTVTTPNPSRDSALIDAGLNADITGQITLFGDYAVQAGQSNYFGQSVQAGVKIGF